MENNIRPQFRVAFVEAETIIGRLRKSGNTDDEAIISAFLQNLSYLHIKHLESLTPNFPLDNLLKLKIMKEVFLATADNCFDTIVKQLPKDKYDRKNESGPSADEG
jgi:glucose-6-phosphate 1-dehydrogenase